MREASCLLKTCTHTERHLSGVPVQPTPKIRTEASQAGIKRESGSVLAPWWVEGRAAFLVGREAVTRAD